MTDHPPEPNGTDLRVVWPHRTADPLAQPLPDATLDRLELTDAVQALEARRTRAIVGAVEQLQDVVVEQREEASGERDAETAVVVKAVEDVADAVDALRQTVEQRLPFHDWTSVLITLVRTGVCVVGICAVLAFAAYVLGALPGGVTIP